MLDEADIVFDKGYSGATFAPTIKIDSPEVQDIIKHIWANRTNGKLRKSIRDSE